VSPGLPAELSPPAAKDEALRERLIRFVRDIGLDVREMAIGGGSLLPGLDIRGGAIVIDRARWTYPGDLLHEAGHLAVVTAEERASETLSPTPADEMAAIAWSFAAACHLGVPSHVLFHDAYKAGGATLTEAFSAGRYFGTPLLGWFGMTIDPHQASHGASHGTLHDGPPPYPYMLRWLR
jgi:hypothetical protein